MRQVRWESKGSLGFLAASGRMARMAMLGPLVKMGLSACVGCRVKSGHLVREVRQAPLVLQVRLVCVVRLERRVRQVRRVLKVLVETQAHKVPLVMLALSGLVALLVFQARMARMVWMDSKACREIGGISDHKAFVELLAPLDHKG